MTRIALIAAGGNSSRTTLGEYTTKAALSLGGKTLLSHQLDFAKRSGIERAIVVCRPRHARLLGSLLSLEERAMISFVMLPDEGAPGWAGTVECAAAHLAFEDEVLLLPCDNLQTAERAERLGGSTSLHTYTWSDSPSTSGPVFGCMAGEGVWRSQSADGFRGDLFTGYAVVRGGVLREVLREVQKSARGEKEMTDLLLLLQGGSHRAVPYPGDYLDVSGLHDLAQIDARLRGDPVHGEVQPGYGVVPQDEKGRVLLTERQDGCGWVPPGGLGESGESPAEAASRELREETGILVDVQSLRLLGVYPCRGKTGQPAVSIMFHARIHSGTPWHVLGHSRLEVRAIRWFTKKETVEITIPFNLRNAVEDAFAGRELDCR